MALARILKDFSRLASNVQTFEVAEYLAQAAFEMTEILANTRGVAIALPPPPRDPLGRVLSIPPDVHMNRLVTVLDEFPGRAPVFVWNEPVLFAVNPKFNVEPSPELEERVRSMFGPDAITVAEERDV